MISSAVAMAGAIVSQRLPTRRVSAVRDSRAPRAMSSKNVLPRARTMECAAPSSASVYVNPASAATRALTSAPAIRARLSAVAVAFALQMAHAAACLGFPASTARQPHAPKIKQVPYAAGRALAPVVCEVRATATQASLGSSVSTIWCECKKRARRCSRP